MARLRLNQIGHSNSRVQIDELNLYERYLCQSPTHWHRTLGIVLVTTRATTIQAVCITRLPAKDGSGRTANVRNRRVRITIARSIDNAITGTIYQERRCTTYYRIESKFVQRTVVFWKRTIASLVSVPLELIGNLP